MLDLLTARFARHEYAPHAHDEYTVGVTVGGLETIAYRGGRIVSGPGSIVVLEPGEMHTGGPAAPEGYSYRALYAAPLLLGDGLVSGTGLPHFPEPVLHDRELAAALRRTHTDLSARPDPLEAESRLPWLLAALARRHSASRAADGAVPGARSVALTVRDRLADELLTPPSLGDLAADLGLSRYQLLRAFRTTMGVPPYAWLAQYRVTRARALLDAGVRPAPGRGPDRDGGGRLRPDPHRIGAGQRAGAEAGRAAGTMVGTADEPGGRPRGVPLGGFPRNVRAPQGRVVANSHPG